MITVRCRLCGADFTTEEGNKVDRCGFCACMNTIPVVKDEKEADLFYQASKLRGTNYFEKSAAIYESILKNDPDNPEAHFGLVMCAYGVEYAGDAWGRTLVCNRFQEKPVFENEHFKKAVKLSDSEVKDIYDNIAYQINGEQERFAGADTSSAVCDVIVVSKQFEGKDLLDDGFDPDDDHEPVKDFELAKHVYDYLSRKGYRMFMTGKNLKGVKRQDAIPMLSEAIRSAKLLILVGTEKENIEAASVEGEWMRFIVSNRGSKNKGFVPCYFDMEAGDLPPELSKLSPIDMSKDGYEEEILKRVSYYTGGSNAGAQTSESVKEEEASSNASEETRSQAPAESEEAEEDSGIGGLGFDEEELGFDILEATQIYDAAYSKEMKAKFDFEFREAADSYSTIKGFRDSKKRAQDCYQKAEDMRREALYQEALRSFHKCKDDVDYVRTKLLFETISGYKDADGRARECAILSKRVKKQMQQEIIDKELEAIEKVKAAEEKEQEQERIKEEAEDKPSLVLRILTVVVCLAALGALGFFFKDQILNAVSYYRGLIG